MSHIPAVRRRDNDLPPALAPPACALCGQPLEVRYETDDGQLLELVRPCEHCTVRRLRHGPQALHVRRECSGCGKTFLAERAGLRRCISCRTAERQLRVWREQHPTVAKDGLDPRPCADCGESFVPSRRGTVYCPKCRTGAAAVRRHYRRYRRGGRPPARDCQDCGRRFQPKRYDARYCPDCQGHAAASRRRRKRVKRLLDQMGA